MDGLATCPTSCGDPAMGRCSFRMAPCQSMCRSSLDGWLASLLRLSGRMIDEMETHRLDKF
jgi:hypothetical protein